MFILVVVEPKNLMVSGPPAIGAAPVTFVAGKLDVVGTPVATQSPLFCASGLSLTMKKSPAACSGSVAAAVIVREKPVGAPNETPVDVVGAPWLSRSGSLMRAMLLPPRVPTFAGQGKKLGRSPTTPPLSCCATFAAQSA